MSQNIEANGRADIPVVLGTIAFGRYDGGGVDPPFPTAESVLPLLDTLNKHGYRRVDTAHIYGQGGSEELLGELDRKLEISTKLWPTESKPLGPYNQPYSFDAKSLRSGLTASLSALRSTKVEIFYLYAPDATVPLESTLATLNELHRENRFDRWGLCNFPPWLVARVQELCIKNDWVRPTVYQGIYNPLKRAAEAELIPCLRFYAMSFEAAQPLASGLLTGRYWQDMPDSDHPRGGRFDPSHPIGLHLRERYWHKPIFEAVEEIRASVESHGLSMRGSVLRWIHHHSALKTELGDALVFGASTPEQLEEVLSDVSKGPLPEEVVKAIDSSWSKARLVL
ncbi:MAG: hypothetical protein Q9165_008489 [Trypethelium subeluteriae]